MHSLLLFPHSFSTPITLIGTLTFSDRYISDRYMHPLVGRMFNTAKSEVLHFNQKLLEVGKFKYLTIILSIKILILVSFFNINYLSM